MLAEKTFGRAKTLRKEAPETLAAHFRSQALEAMDRPAWMFRWRFVDQCFNAEPLTHRLDFAEGYASLDHSEWSRVHPKEHDAFWTATKPSQVRLVPRPCILQRVVNMRDRSLKPKFICCFAQL